MRNYASTRLICSSVPYLNAVLCLFLCTLVKHYFHLTFCARFSLSCSRLSLSSSSLVIWYPSGILYVEGRSLEQISHPGHVGLLMYVQSGHCQPICSYRTYMREHCTRGDPWNKSCTPTMLACNKAFRGISTFSKSA